MSFIGGSVGYTILRLIHAGSKTHFHTSDIAYESASEKLLTHFGPRVFEQVKDRTVVDFGCGFGNEVIEFAKRGAKKVIGVEIQKRLRKEAEQRIRQAGVTDKCTVTTSTSEKADFVMSLDSFEHFHDPAAILELMASMLHDDGEIWISFGWPWYHPYGGHLFAVFPWAHLIFTEAALCRWRADFKSDGATKFEEVEGGLNQMSIKRLEKLVGESPLEFIELKLTPIRPLRWVHCKLTREFTSAIVLARLRRRS